MILYIYIVDLPDEFYNVTVEDIQRQIRDARAALNEESALMTNAMREVIREDKKAKYEEVSW